MIITLLVALLVLLSFALVIGVPVVLATPGEWETSKDKVFNLATAWSVSSGCHWHSGKCII